MSLLDIFNDDAFSLTSLTATLNDQPYKPGRIGELGLFKESGINTTTAMVESRNGELILLPTSERGAPAPQAKWRKRQVRSFVIPHIPYDSTIVADEVRNVRAFGSEMKLRRKVDQALGAQPYSGLRAFCGADFYDALVAHDYVKDAYHRYQDSALLRNDLRSGFRFGDIDWEEYRGQVGDIPFIKSDEAYVIPEGTGIFRTWFAPADFIETVNTIGLPRYAKQKIMDFDKGVQLHTQSNPLPICLKPRAVIKCKMN